MTIDGTNYFCWNTDSAAKTAAMTICLSDKDETEGAVKLGSLRTISLHAVAASGSLDQVLRGENEPTTIVDTKNPTLTLFAAYGDNVVCDVITRGENVYVVAEPVADAPDAEKQTETKITLVGTISDEHFKAPENWFADSKVDVQWKAEEKTFTYFQTVKAGETVELRLPDCVFEDLAGRKLESAVILGKADESGLQSSQMLAVDETTGKLTGKAYVGCVGSDKPDQDQSAPTIGITDDKANKFETINNVPVYDTVGEIRFEVDVTDADSGLASVEYWCDGEEHKTLEPDALVITLPIPENTECDRKLHVRATDNAGNSREVVKSFAIDTWAPRITVTAVSAQPANEVGGVLYYQNGVTYTVSIVDKHLDTHTICATVNDNKLEETTIKLENDGDKLTRLTAEATDRLGHKANWDKLTGKTAVVDRTNPNAEVSFAKDKKTGTLTVTVQATDANLDLEKSYVAYDTATQKLLDVGYGKTAPTIKIQEINPNEIRNEKVVLSTGSESVTLKKGTDYTVETTTGKDCWNGALYSVKASVFEKNGKLAEGSYELTFFSEDSANHSNSNRANEAGLPVRFTLDTSAPVVVITGVDNGDRIRAASRDVTLFYSDSSGIKEIIIYLDGKEYLRLSAEELAKHPDSYTFTVDQSNSGRVLSVKVLDAADNEVKTDDIRFFLNSSAFLQYLHNAVLLAITGAVLALAIVLAILLIRRKKRAAHASNT